MTSVKDKNKMNQNINNNSSSKINVAFGLSIINMLLVLLALVIAGFALYKVLNDEKKTNLFLKGISDSKLLSTSGTFNNLYTYYTQANDKTLQKYSGYYSVTINNASNIDFIVTDQNDNNITGKIEKPSGNTPLPIIVNFKAQNNVNELRLKYKTSREDISLFRIDIKLD